MPSSHRLFHLPSTHTHTHPHTIELSILRCTEICCMQYTSSHPSILSIHHSIRQRDEEAASLRQRTSLRPFPSFARSLSLSSSSPPSRTSSSSAPRTPGVSAIALDRAPALGVSSLILLRPRRRVLDVYTASQSRREAEPERRPIARVCALLRAAAAAAAAAAWKGPRVRARRDVSASCASW